MRKRWVDLEPSHDTGKPFKKLLWLSLALILALVPAQTGPVLAQVPVVTRGSVEIQDFADTQLRIQSLDTRDDLYLVRFSGPVQDVWKIAVTAEGCELHSYIGDNTFIGQMDHAAANAVEAHDYVQSVTPYAETDKLAVSLRSAEPARNGQDVVTVTIQTLPRTDLDALAVQVGALGGEVLSRDAGTMAGYLRVALSAGAMEELAALRGVLRVEPYLEPSLTNDAGGGSIMHADEVRANLGLYGQGQIVAVADSGLDTGDSATVHADVRGRVIKTYSLGRPSDWSDPIGHGTHVAGSVLGNGTVSGSTASAHDYTGSYAGVAPEAQLVFQSLGDAQGGLGGIPTDEGDLMRQAYQDGARIHTNSWGGATGGTTEAPTYGDYVIPCRQIDQAMWDLGDMLVLFSAGNSGADADRSGFVDYDSIGQPGTAKNVLTVGASENLRNTIQATWGSSYGQPISADSKADNTSGMAAFSSRGPTDDGRVKPDLVAPGSYIVSMRTQDYVVKDDMEDSTRADAYSVLTLNGGTGDTWHWATDSVHSGTHAWKASPSGSYAANAMSLLLAPVVNVQPTGSFDVALWHKYRLGGDNRLAVLLTDNDLTPEIWLTVNASGTQSDYAPLNIGPLPTNLCNQQNECLDPTQLGVGFAIYSQSSTFNSDWWIDDLTIDGADWGTLGSLGLAQPGDTNDQAYITMGGTSMSTPLTAGGAALAREWLAKDKGYTSPSGALIKSVLINGTADMAPGQYGTGAAQEIPSYRPNYVSGWGRVDLKGSMNPTAPRQVWVTDNTAGLSTGSSVTYELIVGAAQTRQQTAASEDVESAVTPSTATAADVARIITTAPLNQPGDTHFLQAGGLPSLSSPRHVAPTAADTTELIQNSGFESGWTSWQTAGSPYIETSYVHSGSKSAGMDNIFDSSNVIVQQISVPADATTVALEYWYRTETYETATDKALLSAGFWALDGTALAGSLFDLAVIGSQDWTKQTITLDATGLAAVKGETVYAGFKLSTQTSALSYVWIDDVSVPVDSTPGTQPAVTVTPASGPRGTCFAVQGTGFTASDTIQIKLDSAHVQDVTSDGSGAFTFNLTPSASETKGQHTLTATDSHSHSASDTFEIVPQVSVTVAPASGNAGDSFTLSGTGFRGLSDIAISLDGDAQATVTADNNGAFSYSLSTAGSITAGTHTVTATDDEASSDSATFQITNTAPTGGQVRVTLAWTDYPGQPGAAKALVNDLDLEIVGPDGTHYYGNQDIYNGAGDPFGCRRDGKWDSCNNVEGVIIPAGQAGTYQVIVHAHNIPQGPQPFALTASGDYLTEATATNPRQIGVSPGEVANGATLAVSGQGFTAGADVDLVVEGAVVKTVSAGGSGAFTTSYVPNNLSVGEHTLYASDSTGQAETTFTVVETQRHDIFLPLVLK